MFKKISYGIAAFVLAVAAALNPNVIGLVGGTTNLDRLDLSEGLTVGTTGATMAFIKFGTMNCTGYGSIAASSTGLIDCPVTGVTKSDTLFVQNPTSSPSTWEIVSAGASTTNGYITVRLYNGTGAAAIPPATATSSLRYLTIR